MRLTWITILLIVCTGCYISEELPPDQETWEYAHPSEEGLNSDQLLSLNESLNIDYFGQVYGLTIIKNDKIVFENYYNYSSRNELTSIGNATFGILCLSLDLFIQQGLITNLDQPIFQLLPEYQSIFSSEELKKSITIKHLLNYTSGLVWREGFYPSNNINDFDSMRQSEDWVKYVLSSPLETPPGGRVSQNSGAGMVIAKILQNQIEEPLLNKLDREIFQRMSITDYHWQTDPNGILNGADGLQLNLLGYSKFGYLVLQDGRWTKNERIISRDWIYEITEEKVVFNDYVGAGNGWWYYNQEFLKQLSPFNIEFKSILGTAGNHVFIIPDEEMVVAISAGNIDFRQLYDPSLSILVRTLYALNNAPSL